MAVDPDFVMVPPTPMSRNPNPINPTDVVARPMDIVRPVTDFDIHNDSICHGCHCCQHCQKYCSFPFGNSNVRPDGMLMSSDLNDCMKECGMESRSLLGTATPPLHYFPRPRKSDRPPTIVPRCEHFILLFAPIAKIFYVRRMS